MSAVKQQQQQQNPDGDQDPDPDGDRGTGAPAQGPHRSENGAVSPDSAGSSPGGALVSRVDGCVLPYLGGFGRYQKQLVLLTWIPALFIGCSQLSDLFLLTQPLHSHCTAPNSTQLPVPTTTHTAVSMVTTTPHWNQTRTQNSSSSSTHTLTQPHCYCQSSNWTHQLQSGLNNNVVTQWNLVCDSAWQVHIAKFSLRVGSIFGFLVLGVLADWFGRHPVLIVSVFFTLVFGLAVAFSVNVTMFSTLRFFEGFWLAGITLSLYVLRIELCLPGWRFSMTMVANFVELAGQLLMPAVAMLCSDWQILQAIIVCPLFLMLFYIWLFPESLRWLLATHQFMRSKWQIENIAKKNNTHQESHELISELNRVLERKPKKTCIVKMVGTRNLWKNIVVLCVNSLAGYGIHHCFARSKMDPDMEHNNMFHNFYSEYYTMTGIAIATGLALCPAVGMMGRRGGLLLFMIITALASLLQLGLLNLLGKYSVHLNIKSDTLKSKFNVAFSIIGMFSSQAVSTLSIFFCAEITPTVIRGGGLGLVLASAGFGMLTAPIMDLHNQKGYFLHHVIFACCTLICIICILLLPESRHQPLPESLSEGEGYTRHPLLPPHKKPAEQRHLLLNKDEGANDYANARGTPLHEVAVSTVESTASSATPTDDDDLGADLNAIQLSVLKHRHDSSPTRTDPLPGLVVQPDTSETPPPFQSEINSSDSLDAVDSPGQVGAEALTPPHPHSAPTPSPPADSDPGSSDRTRSVEPQTPENVAVPPSDQTVPDAAPVFTMDSTVSSPIDIAVDCTISPVNGGSSP